MANPPGFRGSPKWKAILIVVGGAGLVAASFASCANGLINAAHGTAALSHPTDAPFVPESAYQPAPSFVPVNASDTPTPFPEPTRMTITVASMARASSSTQVVLPTATASGLRSAQQVVATGTVPGAIVVTPTPTIRRVVVDMQFASRDAAQDAQAQGDLRATRVAVSGAGEQPAPEATAEGYVRPSQYELGEEDFISARLTTDVNSEHPGQVLAVVTVPVYDSATHATLLIPAGTILQGDDSTGGVSNGQGRLLVTWRDIIFPNQVRYVMGSAEGADAKGAAGIPGDVNTHRGQAYGQAALYTLLGAAGSLLRNIGNHSQVFLPSGGAGIGTLFAQQAQSLQPTISIPSDSIVHVYATRPLPLRPYAEIAH